MYSTLQSVQCDPCGIWHLSALRTKEGNDPAFVVGRLKYCLLSALRGLGYRECTVRDVRDGRSGLFACSRDTRNAMTHQNCDAAQQLARAQQSSSS